MTQRDKVRRDRVIRLAAQYVARKERGENVMWANEARISRLDEDGEPVGEPISVGPIIWSGESLSIDGDA